MSMAKRSGDQVAAAGEGFGGLLRAYRGRRRPSFRPEPAAACSPVSVAPRQLPPDIADFVGHTELVGKLQELFESRPGGTGAETGVPPLVICAVAGKAGVGKSALAVHVAHRLASAFPDGQLYASLGGGGSEGWRSAARGPGRRWTRGRSAAAWPESACWWSWTTPPARPSCDRCSRAAQGRRC
jgi:hypothetical protein